jgi:hypothetical protein
MSKPLSWSMLIFLVEIESRESGVDPELTNMLF